MKISIIGAGNIGLTIYEMLSEKSERMVPRDTSPSHDVQIGDMNDTDDRVQKLDATKKSELKKFLKGSDAVISAAPFFLNKLIIDVAIELQIAYFDLTEDTDITQYAKLNAKDAVVMPQCGLAPGAINIIANGLAEQFKDLWSIKMKVGALPVMAENEMKYYRTWSTAGVVNEYCNPCDVIIDGNPCQIPAMGNLDSVIIDGDLYESFSTSGGVGTLTETYKGKVRHMSYETLRYPGHCDKMKFLLNDLRFRDNREALVEILDMHVPTTKDDVVVLHASVVGGAPTVPHGYRPYTRKIYAENGMTAIQRTTASGVCAIIELFHKGDLPTGFVRQEQVSMDMFLATKHGQIFK